MDNEFKIFSTSNSVELAERIAEKLQKPLGRFHSEKFSDGEVFVRYDESIRGRTLFLVAQANMPYENLFELYLAVDAAKRASAKEIIVVMPYMPHSRQERKDTTRTSIASRVVADFLQGSGADRLMAVDLHTNSIEGFFKIPLDHLDVSRIFIKHIRDQKLENLCLVSPDFGGLKRVKKYKQVLECDMAVIHKERLVPNQVSSMEIIGEVADKSIVIIDDIVDTAGTLCAAAQELMDKGAREVIAYCTHGLLSGPAIERINNSQIKKLYITDTIEKEITSGKIHKVSCDAIIAQAITNLLQNKSIKELNEEIIN